MSIGVQTQFQYPVSRLKRVNETHSMCGEVSIQHRHIRFYLYPSNNSTIKQLRTELAIQQSLEQAIQGPDRVLPIFEEITSQNRTSTIGLAIDYTKTLPLYDWMKQQRNILTDSEYIHTALSVLWRLSRLLVKIHQCSILHNNISPKAIFVRNGKHKDVELFIGSCSLARYTDGYFHGTATPNKDFSTPEVQININHGDQSSDLYSLVKTWVFCAFNTMASYFTSDLFKIPSTIVTLLNETLKQNIPRNYQSSEAFHYTLSDLVLFFENPTHLEVIEEKNTSLTIGWIPYHSSIKIPIFSKTQSNLIYQIDNRIIRLQASQSTPCIVRWKKPHSDVFIEEKYDSPSIPWRYIQHGAFADIYPLNSSTKPSKRVILPTHNHNETLFVYQIDYASPFNNWMGVETKPFCLVRIFKYTQADNILEVQTTKNQLRTPIQLKKQNNIYILCNQETGTILKMIQYSSHRERFESVRKDAIFQRHLPRIKGFIDSQIKLPFGTYNPNYTQETHLLLEQFKQEINTLQHPLLAFVTKRTLRSLILLGQLLRLKDHPIFERFQPHTWKVVLEKFLHFPFESPINDYTIFDTHLDAKLRIQTATTFTYWDSKHPASHCLHQLFLGSYTTPHRFKIQTKNHISMYSIYNEHSIVVGKWSQQQSSHLPLPLPKEFPTSLIQITDSDITINPEFKDRVSSTKGKLSIRINQQYCTNTRCSTKACFFAKDTCPNCTGTINPLPRTKIFIQVMQNRHPVLQNSQAILFESTQWRYYVVNKWVRIDSDKEVFVRLTKRGLQLCSWTLPCTIRILSVPHTIHSIKKQKWIDWPPYTAVLFFDDGTEITIDAIE